MGILSALSLAVAAIGAVKQRRAAKKASRAQKEANNISQAQQTIENRVARRRALREARLKRASILASSDASGVIDSSGAMGATGALNTNLGATFGEQRGSVAAANGISRQNQRVSNAQTSAQNAANWTALFQKGIQTLADSQSQ